MNTLNGSRKYIVAWIIFFGVAGSSYILINRQALGERFSFRTPGGSASSYTPDVFAEKLNSMGEGGRLKTIHDLAGRSRSGKAVVVFFSSVSTSCSSGVLLSVIKDSARRGQGVGYTILLPSTFSQNDLVNFKTNLQVQIPVELAAPEVTREWLALDKQYGKEVVNGTVMLADDKKVLSVIQGVEETKTFLEGLGE